MVPTSRLAAESYRQQLHPWCIIRLLPNAQRITVARFRKRNDADAHCRTLRRLIPHATFIIIFAPPPTTSTAGSTEASPPHPMPSSKSKMP